MKKALLALVIAGAIQTGAGLSNLILISPTLALYFSPVFCYNEKTLPRSFP